VGAEQPRADATPNEALQLPKYPATATGGSLH